MIQSFVYKYIKINKVKYKYVFYASADSYNWIEVGNVKFANSGVIGFFIYGTKDQDLINNSHCYFNDFALWTVIIFDMKQKKELLTYFKTNKDIFNRFLS